MVVAVADMPEGDRSDAGQLGLDRLARLNDELGDFAHRHRDIVLDAAAVVFLPLDHALPDAPERARLGSAGGDGPVLDETVAHGAGEERLERLAQPDPGLARRNLEQRVPAMRAR